jgi:hypothetical protein
LNEKCLKRGPVRIDRTPEEIRQAPGPILWEQDDGSMLEVCEDGQCGVPDDLLGFKIP